MITHKVIIEKPRVVANAPAIVAQSAPWVVGSNLGQPTNSDQNGFNEWLDKQIINQDDFCTMLPHTVECKSLLQVHMVAQLETDFNKLKWSRAGVPDCFLFVQCEAPMCAPGQKMNPWVRWDNPNGYRMLTKLEYDNLIFNNYDNLQSNCYKLARQFSSPATPSCTPG